MVIATEAGSFDGVAPRMWHFAAGFPRMEIPDEYFHGREMSTEVFNEVGERNDGS